VPFVPGADNVTYVPAAGTRTPGATRLGGGRFIAAPSFPAPEVTQGTTWNTGVGGDKGPLSVKVNGTVQGEAKLTVLPGSELVRIAEQAKQAGLAATGLMLWIRSTFPPCMKT
jgi:hypothetical protein